MTMKLQKRVLISVTQKDIDEGRINDCVRCPIAQACSRTFGREYFVTGIDAQPMRTPQGWATRRLPRSARRFIQSYDRFRKVEPFRFYLENPKIDYSPFV
jgi:hypothetical protein